jgi:hypothetical protein
MTGSELLIDGGWMAEEGEYELHPLETLLIK